ncbi:MAG: GTP cyclohydrolase I, partial [Elusimicrobiota bacterium]
MSRRKTRTEDPIEALSAHVLSMLESLGEDPGREGLLKTPERVARSLREMTAGYRV